MQVATLKYSRQLSGFIYVNNYMKGTNMSFIHLSTPSIITLGWVLLASTNVSYFVLACILTQHKFSIFIITYIHINMLIVEHPKTIFDAT